MTAKPRWVREIARRLLAKPGITESPRCEGCQRLMAVRDMRGELCVDCDTERFDMTWDDDGPFLPSDE